MVCACVVHPFPPWTKWLYCSLTTLNSRLQLGSSHPPNVHLASTVFGPVTLMERSSCLEVAGSNRMLTAWRYLLRPTVVFVGSLNLSDSCEGIVIMGAWRCLTNEWMHTWCIWLLALLKLILWKGYGINSNMKSWVARRSLLIQKTYFSLWLTCNRPCRCSLSKFPSQSIALGECPVRWCSGEANITLACLEK